MIFSGSSKYKRERFNPFSLAATLAKSVSLTAPYVIVVVIVVVVPVAIRKFQFDPVVVGAINGAKLFFH